ncbi:MAG: SMC-Scp complex subunit ScpB [Clostridia bacterium]
MEQAREAEDRLLALLFAAGEPLPLDQLETWFSLSREGLGELLEGAERRLADLPWRIRLAAGGARLILRPEPTAFVRELTGERGPETFSLALWECLAVVAYTQPVTRLEVEQTRQVQSDYALEMLVRRGLIEEVGRKETPGRPILYGTTRRFLEVFGVNGLDELPPRPGVGGADAQSAT